MASNRRFPISALRLLLTALAVVAMPAAAQAPAGSSRYVVVLTGHGTNPILSNYGATLQEKWGRRLVVLIPDNRVADLRADPAVKYAQAVVDPASVANETQALSRPLRSAETSWSPTSWQSGTYTYDGSGNIRSIGADQFAYDPVGRLTQARLDNTNFTYTYDPLGNRTSITLPGGVTIPSPVSGGNNRLDSPLATYDASGNVLTLGGSDYTYDALGSMTTARDNGNRHIALYTARDERLAFCDSGQCTWTVRGADQQPLRVFESASILNGGTPHTFLWVEDYAYRGSTLLGAARETTEGGYLLFHPDHLGTPRLLTTTTATDGQARDMVRHDYEPFGLEETSISQETALGHDRTEPIQYTGHERVYLGGTLTGNSEYLDYMHARYYAPTQGRFLSVDPSMDLKKTLPSPQLWNRYAYVTNNPIRYTDPDGRDRYQEPGLTKPYSEWRNALEFDEQTPTVIKSAFYVEGGLLALSGGYAGYEALKLAALRAMVRIATWGAGGATTAEILQRAADGGGPTEHVVTNLTQAPQEGRALSAATGEGADALANAARSGSGVRTFAANIPKALISGLQQARLLEIRTTYMNGVTATEYRFAPGAAQYVVKFFKDVTDRQP